MSLAFKGPLLSVAFACLFLICSCEIETSKADLILINAKIWTGDEAQMTAEAMAISGEKILSIGSQEEVLKYKGPATNMVDAEGQMVTPGFIDCHVHLISGGRSLLSVDLRDANTPEEFINRIAEFANTLEADTWILEGNWDHTLWGGELPQKAWIDSVTSNNPLAIVRLDGHMMLANSKALALAGIDQNTPDIEGGSIIRNQDGQLTGVLKDNAMNQVYEAIPEMNPAQKEKAFKTAEVYFLSHGVTSVHDVDGFNGSFESYSTAKSLRDRNELSVRINAAMPLTEWETLANLNHINDEWLKTGSLKGFVDGSLGSHTAAFHEAYTDQPGDLGFFITKEEDLYQSISGADKANLQIYTHAIGDKAINTLLNIYERVIQENGEKDRRFRIEHAQHIAPEDISRFADLGVIASMQPYHAIDDGRWAEALIGPERIKTTYAFNSLLNAEAKVVFGSDWAVAPAIPLEGIYAALTRRTLDDKNPGGWVPEQKINIEQALLAYTRDAAYASFEEKIKGTLAPGKLADFILIDGNLLEIDPNKIRDLKVTQTYVGGKKVFDRNQD